MKFNFNSLFSFVLVVLMFVVFPLVGIAQDNCDGTKEICNPIQSNNITELIKNVLEQALRLGMPLLVVAIIYSGFLFVAAQGNATKLETARKSFMYTMIGAAILLGSWALAQLLAETIRAL
ncbi:MAG: hypothetical protein K9L98_03210 [Candidatus Pacebacteria bacterium]|nr:hypothetical protein [Candidatus Paceibacterota bacterium]MCF7862990.1 hypothetical protein [Candidatus Paceibacterota bacterium]